MSKRNEEDKGRKPLARPERAPVDVVRRRPTDERKKLPAELEAFAAGDDDALWRREVLRGRVNDPRPVAATLVPGVANRDARLVYEGRVRRLRAAISADDEAKLGEELAEAVRLAVWRGHAIVSFNAFAEAVLGLDPEHARALAKQTAPRLGWPCEPADDATVALWMRIESGLLEATPDGRVTLRGDTLGLEVPINRSPDALAGVGRRVAPLAREQQQSSGPQSVVDRPHGVAPLSKIIERDRPRE